MFPRIAGANLGKYFLLIRHAVALVLSLPRSHPLRLLNGLGCCYGRYRPRSRQFVKFIQQGLGIFGGAIAHRFGAKNR